MFKCFNMCKTSTSGSFSSTYYNFDLASLNKKLPKVLTNNYQALYSTESAHPLMFTGGWNSLPLFLTFLLHYLIAILPFQFSPRIKQLQIAFWSHQYGSMTKTNPSLKTMLENSIVPGEWGMGRGNQKKGQLCFDLPFHLLNCRYNLSWVVDSYSPITGYRIIYRKSQV